MVLMLVECPYIAIVETARRDCLTRVDNRTATYSQEEVDVLCLTQFYTFSYEGQTWIRLNASKFYVFYTCIRELLLNCC